MEIYLHSPVRLHGVALGMDTSSQHFILLNLRLAVIALDIKCLLVSEVYKLSLCAGCVPLCATLYTPEELNTTFFRGGGVG
jgi:hypothetical protein